MPGRVRVYHAAKAYRGVCVDTPQVILFTNYTKYAGFSDGNQANSRPVTDSLTSCQVLCYAVTTMCYHTPRSHPGSIAHFFQEVHLDSFVEFVEDQLRTLPEIRSRAMFGGHGVYQGDVFFAIIHRGRLYFRTTPQTAKAYIDLAMNPFKGLKNYYEVPVDIVEDDSKLVAWAREAIGVS